MEVKVNLNGTFVSEKISKIRFLVEKFSDPNFFLTGSWGFDTNDVKLWKLERNDSFEDENESSPKCISKESFLGDITGLELINFDNFCIGSSQGNVILIHLKKDVEINNLTEKYCFRNLHKFSNNTASCTAISTYEGDIATVGEDGRLNILSASNCKTVRSIEDADSISIMCVSFINHNEILTGNRMGVIKVFDIRAEESKPQNSLMISCQDDKKSNCVTCIAYHPTQKHIVLGGSEEGSITVYDLRKPNYPASYFTAHSQGITELSFHQTQPTKVFTASEGGELWQWNQNVLQMPGIDLDSQKRSFDIEPWLNGERAKNKFNVTSLISGLQKPINSFDTFDSKIICGCDNEAMYLIENML